MGSVEARWIHDDDRCTAVWSIDRVSLRTQRSDLRLLRSFLLFGGNGVRVGLRSAQPDLWAGEASASHGKALIDAARDARQHQCSVACRAEPVDQAREEREATRDAKPDQGGRHTSREACAMRLRRWCEKPAKQQGRAHGQQARDEKREVVRSVSRVGRGQAPCEERGGCKDGNASQAEDDAQQARGSRQERMSGTWIHCAFHLVDMASWGRASRRNPTTRSSPVAGLPATGRTWRTCRASLCSAQPMASFSGRVSLPSTGNRKQETQDSSRRSLRSTGARILRTEQELFGSVMPRAHAMSALSTALLPVL
jgi:hypothetical protein